MSFSPHDKLAQPDLSQGSTGKGNKSAQICFSDRGTEESGLILCCITRAVIQPLTLFTNNGTAQEYLILWGMFLPLSAGLEVLQ